MSRWDELVERAVLHVQLQLTVVARASISLWLLYEILITSVRHIACGLLKRNHNGPTGPQAPLLLHGCPLAGALARITRIRACAK
jgi:hypothetical protein